jgi:hypothetical protein
MLVQNSTPAQLYTDLSLDKQWFVNVRVRGIVESTHKDFNYGPVIGLCLFFRCTFATKPKQSILSSAFKLLTGRAWS